MLKGTTNLKDTCIVFDLDGTLVDTAPDLTNALNDVLTRRGHDPVPRTAIRAAVGRGALAMIEEALNMAGAQDDMDQMLAEFLGHPGAVAARDRLTASGATLAICTNKRERLSRMLLEALKLDDYFDALAGRDTFAMSKPDPGHLTGVIDLAGGDVSRAIMVGDSAVDIATAQAANVPTILVSFGYAPPPPERLVPDAVIDQFDALEENVYRLLRCRTQET